jgi:hypothetical protein
VGKSPTPPQSPLGNLNIIPPLTPLNASKHGSFAENELSPPWVTLLPDPVAITVELPTNIIDMPGFLETITLRKFTKYLFSARQCGLTESTSNWSVDLVPHTVENEYLEFIPSYRGIQIKGMVLV